MAAGRLENATSYIERLEEQVMELEDQLDAAKEFEPLLWEKQRELREKEMEIERAGEPARKVGPVCVSPYPGARGSAEVLEKG